MPTIPFQPAWMQNGDLFVIFKNKYCIYVTDGEKTLCINRFGALERDIAPRAWYQIYKDIKRRRLQTVRDIVRRANKINANVQASLYMPKIDHTYVEVPKDWGDKL